MVGLILIGDDRSVCYYRILTFLIITASSQRGTNKIAEELQIAYSTAQRGVQKLEEAKIIKQTNSGKRDKIFCATEILTILEEPTKINIGSQ